MSENLILSFPVLGSSNGGFLDLVSYTVEATQENARRRLHITHTLKGNSFISELIKSGDAMFAVNLFYKDSSERQNFCQKEKDFYEEENEIISEQVIDIKFSYAPEITPYIFILKDSKIEVNNHSGLTNFWNGEFSIPAFTKIAHHPKLRFTSGDVSSLLNVQFEDDYQNGAIKTTVLETAGEGEQPITIICAKDVFDELKKGVIENPTDAKLAMRKAIITQVLCHVYAYMNHLNDKDKNSIHSGLLMHMEKVKDMAEQDWEDRDFNASLAATKMLPYAIDALNEEIL